MSGEKQKMPSYLVISAVGPDRPGIVEEVSRTLVQHGANVEGSRMARLGGEFALIMLVSAPAEKLEPLSERLKEMSSESLVIFSRPTQAEGAGSFAGYIPCQLSVCGADHEGIIQKVAHFLTREGINIAELESDVDNAPVTGVELFSMRALIQVPPEVSTQKLRSSLMEIGEELGVDVEVKVRSDQKETD